MAEVTIVSMDRLWIRGTSGSGKTTLGRAVGERLGIEPMDIDELGWLPGWVERPKDELVALVGEVVQRPRWILTGHYAKTLAQFEPRADAIVWLDYPLPLVLFRLLKRTLRRVLLAEPCCNGNRESFRKAFLSRESILLYSIRTHAQRHRESLAFMAETPPPGQVRLRHRNPAETRAWLRSLRS